MSERSSVSAHLLTADNVERLLAILGTGKEEAKTSDQIQRQLGLGRQRTNESTRALVAFAVHVHHHLILSGPSGFWKAGTREEVLEAIRNLEARRIGLTRRIDSLEAAWVIRHGEDLR